MAMVVMKSMVRNDDGGYNYGQYYPHKHDMYVSSMILPDEDDSVS